MPLARLPTVIALAAAIAGAALATRATAQTARTEPASAAEQLGLEPLVERLLSDQYAPGDQRPRTVLGPMRFSDTTFVDAARRHFPDETRVLSLAGVLALNRDRAFTRRLAAAALRECAERLAAAGQPVTFASVRLAFHFGPETAVRLLTAKAGTRAGAVLGPQAANVNPILRDLTTDALYDRATRDVAGIEIAALRTPPAPTGAASPLVVSCQVKLTSCRRWLSLRSNGSDANAPSSVAAVAPRRGDPR